MKKIFQLTTLVAMALVVFSCTKKEVSTEQFDTTAVVLKAYGPQPVVRGGILRFVGSNLDKVVSVTIPGVAPLTPEVVTAGVHSEIRVTVPKDGPELGYPVLTLSDGSTITAKTQLTYSEPIIFESFSPTEVLPGATITIKGDYLNLIHEVILPGEVYVSDDQFIGHDRYSIKVIVPDIACSGKIILGTVDEAEEEDEKVLATLNLIESDEDLIVITAEGALTATSYKAGATVTIKGTNLNLVKKLELEGASVEEFTATESTLTFVLPATATDGEVLMVMASEVAVSAGEITTVVPVVSGVTPAPVKNGAVVTLAGSDLDLVTGLDFPNAAGAEFAFAEGLITATVPEAAQEGELTLHLANGKTVTADLTLVKPVVTGFSANPASAGSTVTIEGTNLDLVASVSFEGVEEAVEVEATETAITVAVPTAAETGKLVLNLKSGATVEVETELAIDKPAGAYIANMPGDLYSPGDMFIIDIENADHLTGVQFDGEDVTYILNGSTLYVQIPGSSSANTTITLVSDNGSVTYAMNIDPGDFIVTPIWTGSKNIDWGGTYGEDGKSLANLAYGGFDWSTVKEGMILHIEYESTVPVGEWYCIALRHGDGWNNLPNQPGQFDNPANPFDFELTKEILDDLVANGGLIITGQNFKITQVSLVEDLRYGETLWKGEVVLDAWGIGNQSLAWGAFDWSTVPAGSTFFVFAEPIVAEGEWWCIQPRHGDNWGKLPASAPEQFDNPESPASFVLTQEVLDDLVANKGLVITGYGCKITKLCLKQ